MWPKYVVIWSQWSQHTNKQTKCFMRKKEWKKNRYNKKKTRAKDTKTEPARLNPSTLTMKVWSRENRSQTEKPNKQSFTHRIFHTHSFIRKMRLTRSSFIMLVCVLFFFSFSRRPLKSVQTVDLTIVEIQPRPYILTHVNRFGYLYREIYFEHVQNIQ